ncbi:unnamed protein product [Cladocopium goreaui]|uniref:Caltractin n=1 Tax=Cladocopium goreaui TaxID=2562237 RepID=A0A9P1M5R5_9DINO|nr:unnamed protein product [Cladocopium goreaui]
MTIGDINIHDYFTAELQTQLRQPRSSWGIGTPKIWDAFREFDTSGDGFIGKDELCELFAKLGKSLTKKQADIILREVDADGNGEIDFEELCYLEIGMSGAKPRADLIDYTTYLYDDVVKQLQQWFSLHDMGEEGQITVEAAQMNIAEQQEVRASVEEIQDVLAQVGLDVRDSIVNGVALEGKVNFPRFAAFWAVVSGSHRKLNYREYLSNDEVQHCRQIFQVGNGIVQEAAGDKKHLSRKQVQDVLKEKNFVRARRHLNRILDNFGIDKKTDIDFKMFCNAIVKLSRRRKLFELSPQTSCCSKLFADGFTVPELQMCGFGLVDFRETRIPAKRLYQEGHFSALDLRRAGYSAGDLRRAGMGLVELRSSGFSLTELRTAGFSAAGLREANRKMHGCLSMGDFTLLPQITKGTLKTWTTEKSQEMLNIQRLTMTPLIREATDGRGTAKFAPLCRAFSRSMPSFKGEIAW